MPKRIKAKRIPEVMAAKKPKPKRKKTQKGPSEAQIKFTGEPVRSHPSTQRAYNRTYGALD